MDDTRDVINPGRSGDAPLVETWWPRPRRESLLARRDEDNEREPRSRIALAVFTLARKHRAIFSRTRNRPMDESLAHVVVIKHHLSSNPSNFNRLAKWPSVCRQKMQNCAGEKAKNDPRRSRSEGIDKDIPRERIRDEMGNARNNGRTIRHLST